MALWWSQWGVLNMKHEAGYSEAAEVARLRARVSELEGENTKVTPNPRV